MTKRIKKESNIFTVTIPSVITHSKEETRENVGKMKMQHNNKNYVLDIYRLADLISQGYSFHACKHDLNYYEPNQKVASIRNKSFVSTQIFAADIDHGNFTVAEIKKMMNSCEVKLKPALIYETQSSREGDRRYRVVFISNRLVESAEEFGKIQSYLMYVFAKDSYKDHKVDVTCKDACRIFYTAREAGVLEVNDVTVDTDKILDFCNKIDIENVRKNLKRQVDDLFAVVEVKPKTLKKKNSKELVILNEEEMSDEFEEFLINNVISLKDVMHIPSHIDLFNGIEFINTLPLTHILGWQIDDMYSCVFHSDTNPSAHIITDGFTEVYKCFSCQDEMDEVYNTFEVLHRLFNKKYNHTYNDTQSLILSLLNIELGSPYQREASKQLEFNSLLVEKWFDNNYQSSNKQESVAKYLKKAGLFYTFREILIVGKLSLKMEPVVNDESEKCATFYMSCRHLHNRLKDVRGHADVRVVNKKINKLCKLGLITKIDKKEIREKFQSRTDTHRMNLVERMNQQYCKIALMQGLALDTCPSFVDPNVVKDIDYYRIPFLSDAVLEQALEMIQFDIDSNVKSVGFTQKQTSLINEELSEKIFRNNKKTPPKKSIDFDGESSLLKTASKNKNIVLTKGDRHILKICDNLIDGWINDKGYFTEDELLAEIDKSRNYFKKKGSKEYALSVLEPFILRQKKLTTKRVNKESRSQFNIPKEVNSNKKIFTIK